jgi:hypothetical protein
MKYFVNWIPDTNIPDNPTARGAAAMAFAVKADATNYARVMSIHKTLPDGKTLNSVSVLYDAVQGTSTYYLDGAIA